MHKNNSKPQHTVFLMHLIAALPGVSENPVDPVQGITFLACLMP